MGFKRSQLLWFGYQEEGGRMRKTSIKENNVCVINFEDLPDGILEKFRNFVINFDDEFDEFEQFFHVAVVFLFAFC